MYLPGFRGLWQNIQKGSFAYNSLFIGLTPFSNLKPGCIADITTLALFFGDEFIDGVAGKAGKPLMARLLKKNTRDFYLQKKTVNHKIVLCFDFDFEQVIPPEVLDQVNTRYNITYRHFLKLLYRFLEMMNDQLSKLPFPLANKTADKITETSNLCFDSFLLDIDSEASKGRISTPELVLRYHEIKTAYMQTKLLELRCLVLGKEFKMTSIHAPGWLDIMRVIQIYDDIQDAIIDDGVQDNLVLSAAFHYFPDEWKWFRQNKQLLTSERSPLLLSHNMPGSIEYCQQMASGKIRVMNWEQQKIMHYLLLKPAYSFFVPPFQSNLPLNNFLESFYATVKPKLGHMPEPKIKSFIIDSCMHIPFWRKKIRNRINISTHYQLRYDLFAVPPAVKAVIYDRLTKT